jgi:hypothetical protein
MLGMGRREWLVEQMLELGALMREPKAADMTDTVERITGQTATTLGEPPAEYASAFPAAA